jgi:hypothetical protein
MSKNRQARRRAATEERRRQRAYQREGSAPSRSHQLRAVRKFDSLHGTRDALSRLADRVAEYAGIPLPLEGERLIVAPQFPFAEALSSAGKPEPDEDDGWKQRNEWYDRRWRCDVIVMERDGKIDWGRLPAFHHIKHDLSTLGCSDAWGLEQESNAVHLLGTMLRHRQLKQYLMTGMFLETSGRSGVTYLFRKLKPTVAIAPPRNREEMRILCALCMHPIAYYAGSWAGAMCPTDDVIAHLALMRGDEHLFWKRCNQHPPYRPEAGL